MKCLLVKPDFARWIVLGAKPQEYRTLKTYVRGRIGIAETGTIHGGNQPMRRIVGDVDLYDCVFCLADTHKGLWVWLLRNPRRYAKPIFVPVQHGPQIFFEAEYEPPKTLLGPLSGEELLQAERDCLAAEREFLNKRLEANR